MSIPIVDYTQIETYLSTKYIEWAETFKPIIAQQSEHLIRFTPIMWVKRVFVHKGQEEESYLPISFSSYVSTYNFEDHIHDAEECSGLPEVHKWKIEISIGTNDTPLGPAHGAPDPRPKGARPAWGRPVLDSPRPLVPLRAEACRKFSTKGMRPLPQYAKSSKFIVTKKPWTRDEKDFLINFDYKFGPSITDLYPAQPPPVYDPDDGPPDDVVLKYEEKKETINGVSIAIRPAFH